MANFASQPGLAALLGRETECLAGFVALLQREQELLGQGAAESLAPLAAEKSAMAVELARLGADRDAELTKLGLPAGRVGMASWLASQVGAGNQESWRQVLARAAEARTLNETNGKLIGMHMQNNQQALGVLMAAVNQTHAATYGPDGQQKTTPGGRSLGSA